MTGNARTLATEPEHPVHSKDKDIDIGNSAPAQSNGGEEPTQGGGRESKPSSAES